jgi:hypothetical protein
MVLIVVLFLFICSATAFIVFIVFYCRWQWAPLVYLLGYGVNYLIVFIYWVCHSVSCFYCFLLFLCIMPRSWLIFVFMYSFIMLWHLLFCFYFCYATVFIVYIIIRLFNYATVRIIVWRLLLLSLFIYLWSHGVFFSWLLLFLFII